MKKKIEAINDLLESWIHSIVLTHIRNFKEEIESIFWKGSYIVDENTMIIENSLEEEVFMSIYQEQLKKWNWRQREYEEIQELANHHKTVLVNGLPIGGLTLTPTIIDSEEGHLIECLWSAEEGIGLGRKIIKYITTGIRPVFAFSKNETFFKKAGFIEIPRIFSSTWAPCFKKP